MKKIFTLLFLALALSVQAQGPNETGTYYQAANGKSGQALKTAFFNIIKSHTAIGYDALYEGYRKTDTRSDGYVRDWYSNATNYTHVTDKAGSYSAEGDCYNREHCVPQSWYKGGGSDGTLKCDIVHVLPTDGYVNNRRSNNILAETSNPSWTSKNGYSRVGTCSVSGYSGTIFEPNDEIKGDIARIYFYMVTCYEGNVASWANNATANAVFDGTSYPAFKTWYLNMLMRWSDEDPIDDIERARNNAVEDVQGNRNPFVDYPGLEEYIWGDRKTEAFDYTNATESTVRTPYFTPEGGTYTSAQSVTIKCSTTGATIYYTTNGSTPSASSKKYTSAITISETTTLKAIAIKNGEKSGVATATYTIKSEGGGDDPIPAGETIWEEKFTGAEAGTAVENIENEAATYVGDGGEYCKTFDANMAGGDQPELLIPKTSRSTNSFTATISLGGASGDLPLSFLCNKEIAVTSTTSGVTVTENSSSGQSYSYIVSVPAGTQTLKLTFATISDQNARIDNLLLQAGEEEEPVVEKKDPQLSFSKTEFYVEEGSSFQPPTLNNPYQVEVLYESDDDDVATVNEQTGAVTIGMPGTVTISAIFSGNDLYLADEASYTIVVTEKPAEPQDPLLAFEQTEFTVEEASDFTPPVLQNPYGVEVVYSSSNEDLAWVNSKTGAIILGDPGKVVITASFAGNDRYLPAEASYTINITEKIPDGLTSPIIDAETSAPIYNMNGQRLSKTQRGVNIVNGKKIIQK
ncbi:MAG: endonuclease [Prevotella sp.]|nr:endonuclease [Prevotella sp.]